MRQLSTNDFCNCFINSLKQYLLEGLLLQSLPKTLQQLLRLISLNLMKIYVYLIFDIFTCIIKYLIYLTCYQSIYFLMLSLYWSSPYKKRTMITFILNLNNHSFYNQIIISQINMKVFLILVTFLAICYMQIIPLTNLQLKALRKAELDKHNQYRARHGSLPLTQDPTLTIDAQKYSQQLATKVHRLVHSAAAKQGKYGENLYWSWRSPTYTYPAANATINWYSEQSKYNYNLYPPVSGTGHFTAMIWKSVKLVGFGFFKVAEKGGQGIYVVANYSPTPNIRTALYYKQNVLKAK